MFYRTEFDGDISEWDVSSVTDMKYMFSYSKFDGDISGWDVSEVTGWNECSSMSSSKRAQAYKVYRLRGEAKKC